MMKLLWFLFCNIFGNKVDLYRTFGEALNELKQQNFLINCNDRYKDTLMYEMEVRTGRNFALSNGFCKIAGQVNSFIFSVVEE